MEFEPEELEGSGRQVEMEFEPEESEESGSSVASLQEALGATNAEHCQLQTELKNWCASAVLDFNGAETVRKYSLSSPPDWKCIMCDSAIKTYPVYQCQMGHLACNACSMVGATCRSYSKAVSRIKSKAVENMMKSLMVTCKFAELGCKEVCKFMDQSKHEDDCSFVPLVCPIPSCKLVGVKNLLSQHLLAEHKISHQVNVGELTRKIHYIGPPWHSKSQKHTREFDLNPSSTLVLLRNSYSKEFHLLHQQSITLGDRLQITSLEKSCKRKYELDVKISKEQTYCYKSVSTPNMQPDGGLLIPKQADGDTRKKRCTVYMCSD